jgi:hypothetical protein
MRFNYITAIAVLLLTSVLLPSAQGQTDFVDTFDDPTLHPYWSIDQNLGNTSVSGGSFVSPLNSGAGGNAVYGANALGLLVTAQPSVPWYIESTMQWTGPTDVGSYSNLIFYVGADRYGDRFELQAKNQGYQNPQNGGRFINTLSRTTTLTSGYRDLAETVSGPSQLDYTVRIEQVTDNVTIGAVTTAGVSPSSPGYVIKVDWAGGIIGNSGGTTYTVYTAGGQYNQNGVLMPVTDTLVDTDWGLVSPNTRGSAVQTTYNVLNTVALSDRIGFNPGFYDLPANQNFEYKVNRFATNLAAIPEPSTLGLLLGVGMVGRFFVRRKR